MVPHLTTALTGPINELEQRILESMPAIERWFRLEWMEHTPPFYTSADLRNAGFKLAPVDTQLFPSGFNNLTPEMLPLAVQAAMAAIEKICPEARNLLLIPESRVQNTFYLQTPAAPDAGVHAGRAERAAGNTGRDHPAADQRWPCPTAASCCSNRWCATAAGLGPEGLRPLHHPAQQRPHGRRARVLLKHLHEQYLLPPLHAGWGVRRKSRHFQSYEEVAKKFAKLLGMDPWLINPIHARCGKVDFDAAAGLDCVRTNADAVLTKVRRKYKEYGINEKPFVVIKADNASGIGVLTVRDVRELDDPERLAQARGALVREGQILDEVIIQEGVPSCERINEAVAEPVVVMIDRYVVGGFYRVHAHRGVDENLSVPGSSYLPLAFASSSQLPKPGAKPGASAPNRFYMYGVIGRLAMLAAAYELEATDPEAENYD